MATSNDIGALRFRVQVAVFNALYPREKHSWEVMLEYAAKSKVETYSSRVVKAVEKVSNAALQALASTETRNQSPET
jgi:hypothetical protein